MRHLTLREDKAVPPHCQGLLGHESWMVSTTKGEEEEGRQRARETVFILLTQKRWFGELLFSWLTMKPFHLPATQKESFLFSPCFFLSENAEVGFGRAENRQQQLIVQVFPVQNKLKNSKVKYKTHLPISLLLC